MNCRSCGNVMVVIAGLCPTCLRDVFFFHITELIRDIKRKEKSEDCFRRDKFCGKSGAECKWSCLCALPIGFSLEELKKAIRELQFFEKNPGCMGGDKSRTCREANCLFEGICLPDYRQLQKAV